MKNRKQVVQALLSAAKVLARDLNRIDPKKFYVVVPIYEGHDREMKRVKDIARGVLDGVQGISDKSEIIMNWYGIARNAIIVMDANKLMKMNKLSRIQYDNPHYLASDGLFALYRLWDKDPAEHGSRGVAENFLESASRGIGKSNDDFEIKAIRQSLQETKERLGEALSALSGLKKQMPDEETLDQILRPLSFYLYDAGSYIYRTEEKIDKIEDLLKYSDSDLLNYGKQSIGYLVEDLESLSERIDDNYLRYEQDALDEAKWYAENSNDEDLRKAETIVKAALFGLKSIQKGAVALKSLTDKMEKFKKEANHLLELGELGREAGTYGYIFGKYIDNNREQFKGLRSFAQHLRKAILSSKDVPPYKRERLEAVPDKAWLSYVTNGFKNIGNVYKDEGEWLVKDRKLKIPRGSFLYVSDPLRSDIRRKLEKGELTKVEKEMVHHYAIEKAEELDRAIEKYGFDKHYNVKRINDRKMEDAKSKFFVRQAERRRRS